ncbi:MAG: PfkB family carbohydrate kinase [Armatimonadota bacterium]|nr:PfkB family carbohydrate kinase [Armatimonadota bacterium]
MDFEIPAVTARATVDLGHAYGVPVIVDAAPPRPYGSKVWGAGTILSSNRLELSTQHVPTFSVPVVDTTGAGDAFMGGLTVAVA